MKLLGLSVLWLALIFAILFLMGCASGPKEIKVPVPITCKTPAPTPPIYQIADDKDGLFIRVQKLLINDKLHEAYEQQLLAWGQGCNA